MKSELEPYSIIALVGAIITAAAGSEAWPAFLGVSIAAAAFVERRKTRDRARNP